MIDPDDPRSDWMHMRNEVAGAILGWGCIFGFVWLLWYGLNDLFYWVM